MISKTVLRILIGPDPVFKKFFMDPEPILAN